MNESGLGSRGPPSCSALPEIETIKYAELTANLHFLQLGEALQEEKEAVKVGSPRYVCAAHFDVTQKPRSNSDPLQQSLKIGALTLPTLFNR